VPRAGSGTGTSAVTSVTLGIGSNLSSTSAGRRVAWDWRFRSNWMAPATKRCFLPAGGSPSSV
jgi:hypothetical protein